ncbi:hypothetical protein SeMB42_g00438 [Synchytrium endobioticum]|uniref:Uncharacterized protein n=1 Tax=Synchytrium endobioticum TaxID=286115 RepID=A0A507DI77_9FUNG|nr:hypothetical protein SeLEV6574_g00302 [Synchytrium endobioticum]TPX54092.1 hypothetical protein SeMB42_g00438 [Synchytrium endobioticum]
MMTNKSCSASTKSLLQSQCQPPTKQPQNYHSTQTASNIPTYNNTMLPNQPVYTHAPTAIASPKLPQPGPAISLQNGRDQIHTMHPQSQIQSYQLGADNGKGLTPAKPDASYVWNSLTFVGTTLLDGADFIGGKLADAVGITQPKYAQYMNDATIVTREIEQVKKYAYLSQQAQVLLHVLKSPSSVAKLPRSHTTDELV